MKILSWEGIRVVLQEQDKLKQRDNMFRLEAIAKAQHKDTLRQVRELLDGIENPYPAKIVMRHISPNIVLPPSSAHIGFNEAIQIIKALLEE